MEKPKVVISGINGFVGRHLARELKEQDVYIIGIGQDDTVNTEISSITDEYHQANLVEQWPAIPNVKAIIHLAGLAAVGPSFNDPQLYINTNSSIVTNMCEYYLNQDLKPRIILASSGAVYDSKQPMPISEDGKIDFSSPYTVSKILNENQAEYYRNRNIDCVIARPFNHIGPGQNNGFILPDLYNKLSSLAKDEKIINTGNIETRRDYTDVRDIVKAYGKLAMAKSLKYHTYNLCSGVSMSGIEILEALKKEMFLTDIDYKIDQSLVRPTDAMNIVGNSSRLKDDIGWTPQITIQQTIADFVKSKSL